MTRFTDLPNWSFKENEISAGVYEVIGRDNRGNLVEDRGVDPEVVMENCKNMARKVDMTL